MDVILLTSQKSCSAVEWMVEKEEEKGLIKEGRAVREKEKGERSFSSAGASVVGKITSLEATS